MTLHIIQGLYNAYNLVNLKTDKEYNDYADSVVEIHSVDNSREECINAIKQEIIDTFGVYAEDRFSFISDYPIVKEVVLTDNTGF